MSVASTVAVAVALVALAVVAWGVADGRWQAHPVLSGSMEPTLPTGSLALVRAVPTASLDVGDVIVFRNPDRPEDLVIHRVAVISEDGGRQVFQTRGDANETLDPWAVTLGGETSYRLWKHLPAGGYASVWLRSSQVRPWLLGIAALLALYAFLQLFLPDRSSRETGREAAAVREGGAG